ncbi:hypothetical protein C0993_012753, partial [Termitomyces sp. T159_Od127]
LPPILIKQGWPMQLQFFLVMTTTDPQDSKPPKTTPMPLPAPEHYPNNPSATPGHHCPSPPPAHRHPRHSPGHHRHDRHISAGLGYHTAHNRHISTSTSNTRHPWPMPRPPSHITITHHRRPNLCMPHLAPAPLLTTPPPHVYAFPVQDLHAA